MATLTADQLSDFQSDMGISDDETVFTDDELNRLYTRAESDYDAAIILALWQLLVNTAKFFDFVSGFTRQEQDTIFENTHKLFELRRKMYAGKYQVRIMGLEIIPPYLKSEPLDSYDWGRDEPVPGTFGE